MCSTTPSAIERRKVYYSGQVQGVGFRYTTQHVAHRYDVAGFVRNLPDGRVELVVEGASDQLKRFLDDIVGSMNGYISSTEVLASSATGEFEGFGIRY